MQDRMHLDCVFSILGDDVCLMLKEMIGEDSPTKRLVDEFTQDVVAGTWSLSRERVEFATYMRDNGFSIIEIDGADQLVRTFAPPFIGGRLGWGGGEGGLKNKSPCKWVSIKLGGMCIGHHHLLLGDTFIV